MYEQAREMYRADGPEELKSLGETEFITGVAAMSASGKYGPTKCIAGITGFVDLRLGSRAKGVIERHISVSDGRLQGNPERLDLERGPGAEADELRHAARIAARQDLP